jgi:hypothetical protein
LLKHTIIHVADVTSTLVQRLKARFINVKTQHAKAAARELNCQGKAHVTQADDSYHGYTLLNALQEFGSCTMHHFCSVFPLIAMVVRIVDYLTTRNPAPI